MLTWMIEDVCLTKGPRFPHLIANNSLDWSVVSNLNFNSNISNSVILTILT